MNNKNIRGRGAQINTKNKYVELEYVVDENVDNNLEPSKVHTKFYEEQAKNIVNFTKSPDLYGLNFVNPYQGCEHGCIYCYARNTHEFWGYSAGVDFESRIMIKKNAADLLEKKFNSKNWQGAPINLSGITDCYQPAEKKYRITRAILEVCRKYKNPVAIVTKNALVLRDIDILEEMAKESLTHVYLSITTMDEKLRQALEPRTVTSAKRFKTLKELSNAGIPTGVMVAPVIPGLTDQDLPQIIATAAESGVRHARYSIVRLNGSIADIFADWIEKNYPDKAGKVLGQIADCHGGKLNDSRFGIRRTGEGRYAEMIKVMFEISTRKYLKGRKMPKLNSSLFACPGQQLSLFSLENKKSISSI